MPFNLVVNFSAETVRFDIFVPELQQQLRRLMREAAGIYYNNIILRLPVHTGFLAGSFDPMKRAATNATFTPGPPTSRHPEIYTHFGTDRTPKNPSTGKQYVTPTEEILTEVTNLETRYLLVFFFSNAIRYYPINDLYGYRKPPWRITEKAIRAAIAFIEANLPKIVDSAAGVSIRRQLISYRPGQPPQKVKIRG